MSGFEDVREHMEVIGADGVHLGTVDRVEGDRIKLIRADSGMGHEEHHHYIPRGLVADVEGDKVRLSARGDVAADLFEQEESGQPRDWRFIVMPGLIRHPPFLQEGRLRINTGVGGVHPCGTSCW
jgi:hypothetical protein